MPYIKTGFKRAGETCYVCSSPIQIGTMNWTYNPQQRGQFAHGSCVASAKANPAGQTAPVKPTPSMPVTPTPTPAQPKVNICEKCGEKYATKEIHEMMYCKAM